MLPIAFYQPCTWC